MAAEQAIISRRRVIWSLNVVAFSWSLGLGAAVTVIPLLAIQLNPNVALAGLVISMGGAGRLVVSYGAGFMLDRFGRRNVAIVGVTIRMVFSFLEGLSPTYLSLVAFRFMSGVGTSVWGTGLQTITADIATRQDRGTITGSRQGFAQLGFIIGPFIGAAAWGATGDIRVPFFINGFSKMVCLLVFLFVMVETRSLSQRPEEAPAKEQPARDERTSDPDLTATSRRSVWVAVLASGFILVAAGYFATGLFRAAVFDTVMPIYVRNVLGLPQSTLGLALSAVGVGGLATSFIGGRAADKWGVGSIVIPGAALSVLGLVLLGQAPGSVGLVALAAMLGAGTNLILIGTQAFAIDVSPRGARGRFFGKTQAALHASTLVGPLIVGGIADWAGFGTAFVVLAAVFAAMVPVGALMARHRVTPEPVKAA